jgi:hypothetical protein
MKPVDSYEKSLSFNETTRRHMPEISILHKRRVLPER